MKLLVSQKDKLYDIIESMNLSPSQFIIEETKSVKQKDGISTIIMFNSSEFYFRFETYNRAHGKHYAIFCPGEETHIQEEYPGSWVHWLPLAIHQA